MVVAEAVARGGLAEITIKPSVAIVKDTLFRPFPHSLGSLGVNLVLLGSQVQVVVSGRQTSSSGGLTYPEKRRRKRRWRRRR